MKYIVLMIALIISCDYNYKSDIINEEEYDYELNYVGEINEKEFIPNYYVSIQGEKIVSQYITKTIEFGKKKVNNYGDGPSEYKSISNIVLDGKYIYLHDENKGKLKKYDIYGNLISQTEKLNIPSKLVVSSGKIYTYTPIKDENNIIIYDSLGSDGKSFSYISETLKNLRAKGITTRSGFVKNIGDTVLIGSALDNSIRLIYNGKLISEISINKYFHNYDETKNIASNNDELIIFQRKYKLLFNAHPVGKNQVVVSLIKFFYNENKVNDVSARADSSKFYLYMVNTSNEKVVHVGDYKIIGENTNTLYLLNFKNEIYSLTYYKNIYDIANGDIANSLKGYLSDGIYLIANQKSCDTCYEEMMYELNKNNIQYTLYYTHKDIARFISANYSALNSNIININHNKSYVMKVINAKVVYSRELQKDTILDTIQELKSF